ncbi:MAG: nucleoside 2-deoxyribosyltransferase domain-containing protein [Alphaproteobacteria bacterium]|jgi:hypothetical protein|nr:nucleoside 2-deoxyribosyltransferase domain-containing protein [Alphaproteobacteria bacterium]
MYSLIKPDEPFKRKPGQLLIYLGGQCRGRDWRLDAYTRFEKENLAFISPRRDSFIDPELDPAGHARQVAWEREAIEQANVCIFWLGEGLSNQAARVEIGYALGLKKPVLLGAQPGFMGVEHLTGFSGLVVASSLEGLLTRFASVLGDESLLANK